MTEYFFEKGRKFKVKDLFIFDLSPDPAVLVVDFDYKTLNYKDTLRETDLDTDTVDIKVEQVNTLVMKVNLREKREKVIKEFKERLTEWRKRCSVKQDKRARLDLYDKYLQIYDLRMSGKTFNQIVETAYPEEYAQVKRTFRHKYDFDPLKEKIKHNLQACNRLIRGGYKIIS